MTTRRSLRNVVVGVVIVGLLVAGGFVLANRLRTKTEQPPRAPLSNGPIGASGEQLTAGQRQVLQDVAAHTWAFLSGPGSDPVTHLPRNNVRTDDPAKTGNFTSPTEIGLYLASIVAARDLGLLTADQALNDASQLLATIQKLATYHGFLLRWYSTATGEAVQGPSGRPLTGPGIVSTVDDSWFGQGVVVAQAAFPQLSSQFGQILSGMDYSMLFSNRQHVLYNSYATDKGPSPATYDLAYGGPRIADYMAIGSGKVPGALWWQLNRTPPSRKSQRQTPVGQNVTVVDPQTGKPYTVFEGHYTYNAVEFVPTFAGSMFQALAPNLVVPEEAFGPQSVGLNNINTVVAQIDYARNALRSPVWGLAPATRQENASRYDMYGAADLATKPGNIPHDAIAVYGSFLALSVLPTETYQNIADLMRLYPSVYTTYGFLDSVNYRTGKVAPRYMAVSQAVILMALDNALNENKLQSYFGGSSYGKAIQPYLSRERFSIAPALAR